MYQLRVGLDVDDDELAIIEAHDLADIEMWASPAALDFDADAERAFGAAQHVEGWDVGSVGKWIGHNANGLRAKRDGDREARVTVGDLLAIHVLEAEEVNELVHAERGIRAALVGLIERVAAADSFGNGEEVIVEPPPSADANLVPPALWPLRRMR